MPRVAVTKTTAVINSSAAITEDNLNTVAASGGKVACGKDESIAIYVENTDGTARTVTVKAGASGAFAAEALGDLVVSCAQNTPKLIGPLEGARFAQGDGYIGDRRHCSA
jgi:hypothetical protein